MVGDLAVRVGADVAGFETGMASAARSVRTFSSNAVSQLRDVTTQVVKAGAAATAAGVAITAALYTKQSKVIDSLAKTADALGVTTEALQAMNHLAELNGVSAESMSKGLRRMEVNLGMAARSGGAAKDALTDIGVSIEDVLKLKPDEQLQTLAAAISNVENQSIKASIATDLFGRDGVKMLKVLNQVQKDGIDPTIKMLDEYGIAISRIDAAAVENANDAFFEAQQVIEGVANTITVALAPFVKEVADRFKDAAKESGGFGDEVENAITKAIHYGAQFADVLRGLHVVFKGVELVAVGFGAAVVSVMEGAMTGIAAFTDVAIASVNSVIAGLNKIPKVEIELINSAANSEFMENLHAAGNHARDSVSRVRDELNNLAMAEMPSSNVEAFIERVKERSNEAAQEVADSVAKITGMAGGGEGQTQEDKYAKQEQALRDHLRVMYDIEAGGAAGIEGLMEKKWGVVSSSTFGAMRDMVSTVSDGSKKAFEVSKKFAIADALISTYQGIAAGVKLGWPAAIPAVAWAAATGFKQISAIKSQTFGGSSSGSATTTTASTSSASSSSSSSSSSGTNSGTLTVAPIDPNAIFSGASMQAFGEKLYDYSKDGGKVVFGA